MPDERQDSIRQGIQAPEESPSGQAAAEERRRRAAEGPPIGGAMGGTSDADRPADEALYDAQRSDAAGSPGGGDAAGGDATLRESREASQRSQGGGTTDEEDIARAARRDPAD